MNLLLACGLLALFTVFLVGPLSTWLAGAGWVSRAPRAAVLVWQSIGFSAMAAGIGAGLCVAVARFHVGFTAGVSELVDGIFGGHPLAGLGLPDALGLTLAADLVVVLLSVVVAVTIRTIRARARHRQLLNLLSQPTAPPVTDLLDDPRAVAYCLPGRRPRIVISSGALHILSESEMAAVVEHERGHAHEHHGLVMLPMTGLRDLFRWVPYANLAPQAVAELLEMAADDYAARSHNPASLASALMHLASSGRAPNCALSFASDAMPLRVVRLLNGKRTSRRTALWAGLISGAVLATPLSIMLVA